jgi:hypothetical protein
MQKRFDLEIKTESLIERVNCEHFNLDRLESVGNSLSYKVSINKNVFLSNCANL